MSTSINELIGALYEAFSGKTELLDAVITDDWDDIPLGPGQEPGRAGARSLIEGLNKVFSDFRMVVEEIIDARGEDGNGMAEALLRNYPEGQWISRERERLTSPIDRAAGEDTVNEGVSR